MINNKLYLPRNGLTVHKSSDGSANNLKANVGSFHAAAGSHESKVYIRFCKQKYSKGKKIINIRDYWNLNKKKT